MKIYLSMITIVYICSSFAKVCVLKCSSSERKKYNVFFVFTLLATLIIVAGFRYKVGTDYMTYADAYMYVIPKSNLKFTDDVAFTVLLKALYLVSHNPQIMFLATSSIINVCAVKFFLDYSDDLPLSIFLYMTTFTYFSTLNGVRQFIAVVIISLALRHIFERNFKKYLVYVLIAALFHQSALFMILVYFCVGKKVDSLSNMVIICIFMTACIFYKYFMEALSLILKNSNYSQYSTIMLDGFGTNILRVLVLFIPVILMYVYRKKARNVFGERIDILINLSLIGALFMLLAIRHVYFARMVMYFEFFNIILITKLCKIFDENSNKIITYIVMLCYFIYLVMLLITGQSNALPYQFNFNIF